jgi:hypothetical protein
VSTRARPLRARAAPRRARLAAACVLLLAGCHGREARVAEDAIRSYGRAVIEAHLTGTTDALDRVTSQDEADRVRVIARGLRARGETLVASLESLRVRSASMDARSGTGTALADERWAYQRVDARTREPRTERIDRTYRARYHLVLRGARWVVDRVQLE